MRAICFLQVLVLTGAALLFFVGCGDNNPSSRADTHLAAGPMAPILQGPHNQVSLPPAAVSTDLGNSTNPGAGSGECAAFDYSCLCKKLVRLYRQCGFDDQGYGMSYCTSDEFYNDIAESCDEQPSDPGCWSATNFLLNYCLDQGCDCVEKEFD